LKIELNRIENEKKIPILDLNIEGVFELRNQSFDATYILVLPTNNLDEVIDKTREWLHNWGTEEEEDIETWVETAKKEIEMFK